MPSASLRSVPLASEGSVAASPVSLYLSQSLGRSAQRAPSSAAGSCSKSHSSVSPAMPGLGRFPVMRSLPGG